MRILITGSRNFTDYEKIKSAIVQAVADASSEDASNVCIVHGGARGADYLAGEVAKELGFEVEVFKANWKMFGKKAGPIRNEKMVDSGADVCLAFPLGKSFGTWNCLKLARKAGIRTVVF